jgi:hypothetical protein
MLLETWAAALDELSELPELLVTTSPFPRRAMAIELELAAPRVPEAPRFAVLVDDAAPANDDPPATIDAAVFATLARREPAGGGGNDGRKTFTTISPNCSGSDNRPSASSGN